ncbi:MAG: phospho-N-acetylmuramoyl-pentapeptide-transferase [Fretibacterium sp.]|nr:phospho-N-acetylmuramoyl-pentapeptide-transferase [Fretibacterium sp.]
MTRAAWLGALFFCLSLVLQALWIRAQRRMSLTQAQKSYGVCIDVEIKAATPSMGGVVFLVLGLLALVMDWSVDSLLLWSLPLAGGAIGLLDDGLKFFSHSSEGFRSLGKLRVQLIVCAVWTGLLFLGGRLGFWPGLPSPWWLTIPLTFLGSVGMMNAVNITDGLDGLAGGCTLISLGVIPFLIPVTDFNVTAVAVLFFMVAGFLFFNVRPAKTFMGDTGAHFLGGALAALCLVNGRLLALLPVGFLFGLETLSSAIQIFTIRKLNRRVFLMAPLHHHFQRKGWDETEVTTRFWLVQAVGAVLLTLLLLSMAQPAGAF